MRRGSLSMARQQLTTAAIVLAVVHERRGVSGDAQAGAGGLSANIIHRVLLFQLQVIGLLPQLSDLLVVIHNPLTEFLLRTDEVEIILAD